jgi:rhamnogalacturonan hydrolase
VARAQLSGSVGPTTSTASKAAKKICNVLSYGAKADKSTDLGPALASAFAACKSGGIVYVPSGDYALATWQTLSGGTGWALQLDGIIYRTGTAGGHMIIIDGGSDFEFFSQTSKGAIQGYGYTFLSQNTYGPRIMRLVKVTNFSVHDLALVDSPAFHMVVDNCVNGHIYNLIIRGSNRGGLDGINLSGTNHHVHDVEVTNKDECVTIKNPSTNYLIENIYCNWSGGCAIGSLGTGTAISTITYRNIYTQNANQEFMIKSNGGDGYVKNIVFENFIGHKNAYSLNVDQYWASMDPIAGNGVALSGLTFKNWIGTEADGNQRGPIQFKCADGAPCTGITASGINMWTESGSTQKYICRSAYGSGYCLKSGSSYSAYAAVTQTISTAPAGYSAPTMAADIQSGLGLTVSIAIPAVPTSFYPGATPATKLCSSGACAGANGAVTTAAPTTTKGTTTTTKASSTPTPTGGGGTAAHYAQCGGSGWTGPTVCESPYVCTYSNDFYSQCL